MSDITIITHPEYDRLILQWHKWRLTYDGGDPFKLAYLKRFSTREDEEDYKNRLAISYTPAFAKAAVNDIKNAIFQRMRDILRKGGTPSYENAVLGLHGGVDYNGRSMNNFIGSLLLSELLSMGKVGVYVDMPRDIGPTQADLVNKHPYLYLYRAEDIRSWTYKTGTINELQSVILRDYIYELDPETQLPKDIKEQYRFLRLNDEGFVAITVYDSAGVQTEEVILNIRKIPLVILEITQSLLMDVADIQVALLNLASSDINYSFKSNFPFYTEQYDPRRISPHIRQNNANTKDSGFIYDDSTIETHQPGTAAAAQVASNQEIVTGATRGRRYPINTERPSFIHPSSEPLEASMKKQAQLKEEIKQLVNLTVANLSDRSKDTDSRAFDEQSLEAGLSYIGQQLEYGERQIGAVWSSYERKPAPTIYYPSNYSLKDDLQRLEESQKLSALRGEVASVVYKKEVTKQIANTLLGDKIPLNILTQIYSEIDRNNIPVQDTNTIYQDIEQGLLSVETASLAKGYPEGEVEKAKQEHAERAARIVLAQTNAAELKDPAARGVSDLENNPTSPDEEKRKSQRVKDQDVDTRRKVRGKGK